MVDGPKKSYKVLKRLKRKKHKGRGRGAKGRSPGAAREAEELSLKNSDSDNEGEEGNEDEVRERKKLFCTDILGIDLELFENENSSDDDRYVKCVLQQRKKKAPSGFLGIE